MTGLLRQLTKADVSPDDLLAHEGALPTRKRAGIDTPAPPTRLRRMLDGWMAAAHAYRERQAALLASHRAGHLRNNRLYRGPIDDALERAARLRRRRKPPLNQAIT